MLTRDGQRKQEQSMLQIWKTKILRKINEKKVEETKVRKTKKESRTLYKDRYNRRIRWICHVKKWYKTDYQKEY